MEKETKYDPSYGCGSEWCAPPVVGLDLSLTSTGMAAFWGPGDIRTRRIRSTGSAGATWDERGARLRKIVRDIINYVPNDALVMVEAPSYASSGAGTHDRSGLWWMVYQHLATINCTIVPVAPAQRMMYATGKGGGKDAGKDNVLAAAIKRYPDIEITGNDVADAVLLMAMGKRLIGEPIEESLPATHLRALDKLDLAREVGS